MNWRRPLLFQLLNMKDALYGSPFATSRAYRGILKLAGSDRAAILKDQESRLHSLVAHSYRHCSYYRQTLEESGAVRGGRVHLEDFEKIPFLTKEIMRGNISGLLSEERHSRKVYKNTSGGSTGEPIPFYQDNVYKAMNWATVLYYNHAVGKELGDREVKLWGSERDILKGSIGATSKIKNFLYNRRLLNAFRMTPETCREYVKTINHFRPVSIWSYVDSIYQLARFVEREGLEVKPVPATITTAGTLTEEIREFVERVLSTKVYNQYGSREVGPVAAEGPDQRGLAIFEWCQYVEVVDSEGKRVPPGATGEIVITLLSNYTMPLIRYRIGDMATAPANEDQTTLGMRRLGTVTGRVTDYFVRKDGTLVHGEYFTHLFYHRNWVRRFQVVQEDYDALTVNLECNEVPAPSEEEEIREMILKVMGRDCQVRFEYPASIQPSSSGKYLYTFSKVGWN
ncbi:MAG: phenylacetate--CoA ligase family protein [Candidatus Omnitrophica bacterium]|nr:phenylacetate--CoA ligase family protein [Candidatus Omnitrophota bacterium]